MKKTLKAKSLKLKARNGQSIAEAIVALGVLAVGLIGILSLLSRSLGMSKFINNNYIATYLAGEGTEVVKNIIDANYMNRCSWNSGLQPGRYEATQDSRPSESNPCFFQALETFLGRPLFYDDTSKLYKYGNFSGTGFTREIRISPGASVDEMIVNAIVRWNTGTAQSSVNVEDHFYNWRP